MSLDDLWFIKKFFTATKIASFLGGEDNNLKFKIAFLLHETAELLTKDHHRACIIENKWRRAMRMKLRNTK